MKRRRHSNRIASKPAIGNLALAPSVAMMRVPLLLAEAGHPDKAARETVRAVTEKMEAAVEGVWAAQMSMMTSWSLFWPELLAGKTPSVLSGVAAERSLDAALAPASRRVAANFRRLSKR